MRTLTPAERRALRAKAHHLHPFVSIGHHGLTPAVLHEIDVNLAAHELVKVRVFNDVRAERDALLARICSDLDAAPVQHLGKILTVWRPAPEPAAPAAREPAKPRTGGTDARRARPPSDERRSRATPAGPRGKTPKVDAPGPLSRRGKPAPRTGAAAPFTDESRARRRRATAGPADPRRDTGAKAKPLARRGAAPAVGHAPAKRPPRGASSGKSRNRNSSTTGSAIPRAAGPGARRRRTPR